MDFNFLSVPAPLVKFEIDIFHLKDWNDQHSINKCPP